MPDNYVFTSESVSEGHPDKVADQVSDAILDAYLEKDPNAKVACETLVAHGAIILPRSLSISTGPERSRRRGPRSCCWEQWI